MRSVDDDLVEILASYRPWLRRIISQHCPPRLGLDPEEIEQQAILRLWRALEREIELDRPASYLYRIVASVTSDAIRATRRKRETSLQTLEETARESAVAAAGSVIPSPLRAVESAEIGTAVGAALRQLGDNRRRAVALSLDGFSNTEIARILAWSEPKVRNLVWRGMKDLRKLLEKAGLSL